MKRKKKAIDPPTAVVVVYPTNALKTTYLHDAVPVLVAILTVETGFLYFPAPYTTLLLLLLLLLLDSLAGGKHCTKLLVYKNRKREF